MALLLLKKYWPHLLFLVLIFVVLWKVYDHGYTNGQQNVQTKWDKETKERNDEINKIKSEYVQKEETNRKESSRISNELAQAKLDHATAVGQLRVDYERRLQQSEKRAAIYQRQAEGGPDQCRDLASYTARLDQSLEEGRSLVREFRETLELRDTQLRTVGEQLLTDRALLEENSNE